MSAVPTLSTKSVLPRVPIPLDFAVVSAWAALGLALATAVFALGFGAEVGSVLAVAG